MTSSLSNSRAIVWMIWIIASVFYAYQYVLRVMPNIMLTDIMQQFHMDALTFGQFSGIYYLGYTLLHLPIGIMLDRFGPRKVMTSCILLTVAGLSPLIFSEHWIYPIIGRFMIGIGSSAAILGVFKIIRMTFSEKLFPRMLSLSVMIGVIGGIYGGGPVNYLLTTFGYQTVIYSFAMTGLALALITYWIIPNIKQSSQSTVISDVKEVLSNPRVIWSCIFAGLMVGPMEGFADVWGTAFLKTVYGFEGTLAASLPSMILVGMCFGSPLLNLIAEKARSYLLTIIGAGIAMAVSFALILTSHLSIGVLTLNFIVVGVCSAYQILAIYKASTYVREQVAGLTTAIANMIIMTFGYAFHSVISSIIDVMGGPNTSQALLYGTVVIPVALCLGSGGFVFLLIKERKTKQQQELSIVENP